MDWMERFEWIFSVYSWNAIFFIKFVFHFLSPRRPPTMGWLLLLRQLRAHYENVKNESRTRIGEELLQNNKRGRKNSVCFMLSLFIHISLTCCDNYSLFTINFSSTYNAFTMINWLSIVDESWRIHLYVPYQTPRWKMRRANFAQNCWICQQTGINWAVINNAVS